MRTTVDLDDDVQAALDELRRTKQLGLSQAVNELVRAGMARRPSSRPFRQRSQALGLTVDVTNVADALDALDGPDVR